MNKLFKKITVVTCVILISILLGINDISFTYASDAVWTFVDGNNAAGMNNDTEAKAIYPVLTEYNNELYAAWTEGTPSQIHVKKYDGSWSFVTTSLNRGTNTTATNPSIISYEGNLYITWQEFQGNDRIHVSKYDGSSLNAVDGDGTSCINYAETANATAPILAVFNGNLYAAWAEETSGGTYQIRISMYTGGSSWSSVDGGGLNGLNYATDQHAYKPNLAVYNGILYATWEENYNGIRQVRVKRYDSGSTWTFVDGDGNTGLNCNSGIDAYNPTLTTYNGNLYLAWEEATYNDGFFDVSQIHIKRYDDTSESWVFVNDNGTIGWNKNYERKAFNPLLFAYGINLYVSWNEEYFSGSSFVQQIRVSKFNTTNGATFIDGNLATGLNKNTSEHAEYPTLFVYNNALYSAWNEDYDSTTNNIDQIRVKMLPLPSASIAEDAAMTEDNLDERSINVTLNWTSFADSTLELGNFSLENAPSSLSIENITYTDSTHCTINLAYDGTDFDSDISNLGLTINGAEISGGDTLTSTNTLTITANNDPESISISDDGNITEGEENGEVITVTLSGGNFVSSLSSANWTVSNLPAGVSKGTVTRINDTTVQITLSGNATSSYASDITDVTVSCTSDEYNDSTGDGDLSANSGVTLIAYPTVTSVSVPANGTYGIGQELIFSVAFDEAVTVDTTGGTPYIPISLDTGGTVNASYSSGSGTVNLLFRYTIQAGNNDNNGISVGTNIVGNGGTLTSPTGKNANLTLHNVGNTTGVLVDALIPTVSSVTVPADGSYKAGEGLNFTVIFNEAVTVNTTGGIPYIQLTLDTGGTVNASYISGSGTTSLNFCYTVQTGEEDPNGITVDSAITANGGTLKDTGGNDAVLTLNNVGNTSAVLVDTVAPNTSSVTVPANGTYGTGQNLDFTVNYDENVTVDTTGGIPYIQLTFDTGGTVNASYISGSGTSALVFRYTVQAGNYDNNGITVSTSISTNGGSLKDIAGNDAILTLNNIGNTTSVLVDSVSPVVTSVNVPANDSYLSGENLDFTVNFDENITVNTSGGTPYIPVTLDTGGTVNASYISGSGTTSLLFCYTVQPGDSDADGITVGVDISLNGGILNDTAGNNAILTLNNVGNTSFVLVDAIAPTVQSVNVPANGTYTSGQTLSFSVNFSEAVTVDTTGGTAYIPITLDTGGTVNASYTSGSTTSSLIFQYTIQTGNEDTNGISLGTAITANGSILLDGTGNNAVLTLNNVGNTSAVLVDAITPTVSSVSVPANGTYLPGQDLSFTINFDEAISVNTTGGTPFIPITLDTGGTVNASYTSGSGTPSLTFQYTIQIGNEDTNGITLDTAINANGGTLKDTAGNNALLTLNNVGNTNAVLVDGLAPTLISAIRTDDTHLTITLSENCTNITKANDGGFTVLETGSPAITYPVSSIAQGIDASHVVLTVADMTISAKEGVTVKYTAGGNGTLQDSAGNLMTTDNVGVTVAPWDTTAPTISSSNLAADNTYLDITFNEGIYGADDGATALTIDKLVLTFTQNGGSATDVQIISLKKNNNVLESSASALTGGEEIVRVFLTITGTPNGVETIKIEPADATSIYDKAGNAVLASQSTTKTLSDQEVPTLISAVRTDDTHLTVTLSKNCTNITKANDGGFTVLETGSAITYPVSSIAQGIDASHVVLTVADMAISAKEGVTVKYTAGGNGTIQDTANNAMATDNTGLTVNAWDTTAPTISSSNLAADNTYLDITFAEGIYGADDGTTPLNKDKLVLTFTQNGGSATDVQINSLKKNDNVTEVSASALTGGEEIVRVFLTITGTPNGVETIKIEPADATSIYDKAGNAVLASQSSGTKTLNNQAGSSNSGGDSNNTGSNSTPPTNTTVISDTSMNKETTTTQDGQISETFTIQTEVGTQIEEAKKEGKTKVQFNINSSQTSITNVNIPAAVIESANNMNISITTPNATLDLPAALVNSLALAGKDFSLTVARGNEIDNPVDTTVLGAPININTDIVGTTQVTIPLTGITIPTNPQEREAFLASLCVFTLHSDGEEQIINASIVFDTNGNPVSISFPVDKFSTFAIIQMSKKTVVLTVAETKASINGIAYTMDACPFIDSEANRTLVPIRFISEALGAKVDWLSETRQVRIQDGTKEIILTIDSKNVYINGEKVQIDCAPIISSPGKAYGRTFIPLRFISETLGATVVYDNTTRKINIVRDYNINL